MNKHISDKANQATERALLSLTPREAKVLSKRFGIEEKLTSNSTKFKLKSKHPKSNGGQGGSGAPVSPNNTFSEKA